MHTNEPKTPKTNAYMDNRALDDSCRLAAALVADISDTRGQLADNVSRPAGRCVGRFSPTTAATLAAVVVV
jgi:hypothetical protein